MSRLAVIIVSYQVRDLLRRCLETVRDQREAVAECWVVDNASTDGSAAMVVAEFPEVKLLAFNENLGFSRANNLGMHRASADVFALVNPDTELPAGALALGRDVLAGHPHAAILGLALSNRDGSAQPSRFAFPGLVNLAVESLGLHRALLRLGFGSVSMAPERRDHDGPAPWVSGACMLVTRDWFEASRGFDETLFMYGEDLDWCWRAYRAGREVWHTTRARVLHHGGASGTRDRGALFVRNIEARLAFVRRNRGAWRAGVARELVTLGAVLRLVYWRLRAFSEGGRPRAHTRHQLERFAAVWAWRRGRAA